MAEASDDAALGRVNVKWRSTDGMNRLVSDISAGGGDGATSSVSAARRPAETPSQPPTGHASAPSPPPGRSIPRSGSKIDIEVVDVTLLRSPDGADADADAAAAAVAAASAAVAAAAAVVAAAERTALEPDNESLEHEIRGRGVLFFLLRACLAGGVVASAAVGPAGGICFLKRVRCRVVVVSSPVRTALAVAAPGWRTTLALVDDVRWRRRGRRRRRRAAVAVSSCGRTALAVVVLFEPAALVVDGAR